MRSINAEDTSLNEFGMTPELLLSGETCEFDAETKLNRKESYVKLEFARKLADAYHSDLVRAYRAIESLEGEVEELKAQNENLSASGQKAAAQANALLKGNDDFKKAEQLLAKFEQQIETFAKDKRADKATIEQLQAEAGGLRRQVDELIELKEKVPQLENDVNQVLDYLRECLEAEGIEVPDYEDE